MKLLRTSVAAALCATALVGMTSAAIAAEAESCKTVKIAAGDWPDIQITSNMMSMLLTDLGYQPNINTLSIPVIFASLKNKDVDVFQGNWMPSMTAELTPYVKEKSIEVLGANLTGAYSGLGVPQYVADAGVKTFADLAANKEKFGGKIYGMEAGNDVNRHMMQMIADPKNNLQGWELVESSEAGMVTEAEKAIKHHEWIAFLPYTPHATMGAMKLHFISGVPDPSFGEATVYTNVRANYLSECANVGTFFKNVKLSVPMFNDILLYQKEHSSSPEDTATYWLKANPSEVKAWLAGVTTFDGKDADKAVSEALGYK